VALRVVLADDAALIRGALAQLLEDGGVEVLAQVGTPVQLLAAIDEHQPDVALVDIRMPPSFSDEGIRAALEIRQRFPEVGILLLSTHVEVEEAVDLFSSAAQGVGYLLKDSVSDLDELVEALTRIAEGGTVLDSKLVVELLEQRRRTDPLDALTPREREVLALMAEGRSNDGIAKTLWVTKGAVEKHIKSIFGKLGLPATTDDHRRVLAVVTFLNAR
jgi:DNA-binding NarL/FixJ family response regulator